MQLRQPLNFHAVPDHAMLLGALKAGADTTTPFSQQLHDQGLLDLNTPENKNTSSLPQRVSVFTTFLPDTLRRIASGETSQQLLDDIAQNAWADTIDAANAHYQPGTLTTFAAYEYTSSTNQRGNLHRNVIFRDTDKLPIMPFSRFQSRNPGGLWDWMDSLRAQRIEALAIPHHSNGSSGAVFMTADWARRSIDDAYAAKRIRKEPVVEITKVKGTSETSQTVARRQTGWLCNYTLSRCHHFVQRAKRLLCPGRAERRASPCRRGH